MENASKQKKVAENALFSIVLVLIASFIAMSFTSCESANDVPVEVAQVQDSISALLPNPVVNVNYIEGDNHGLRTTSVTVDSLYYLVIYTSGGQVQVIDIKK